MKSNSYSNNKSSDAADTIVSELLGGGKKKCTKPDPLDPTEDFI